MKRIGIDARLIFHTGIGTYLRNLIFYLQEIAEKNMSFYIYLLRKDYDQVEIKNKNFIKIATNFYWHSFSEQLFFARQLLIDHLDLMHFTYFSYPILYKKPFIVTIHDLTPLTQKTGRATTKPFFFYWVKYQGYKLVLKNQIFNSQKIITPTKTIKEEIVKIFGKKFENKIFPIYEGVSYEFFINNENQKLKKDFPFPFFIYVGNFYPHKNLGVLIDVFKLLKNIEQRLILIGPDDYFKKILFKKIIEQKLTKKIIFFKPNSIKDLIFFYKNAEALINPSISEGFGLPLVEAIYFNCPVIASNIAVFKEILEDQYISFNPYSSLSIRQTIVDFLAKKRRFNFKKISAKFSFKKMVKETYTLYRQALI